MAVQPHQLAGGYHHAPDDEVDDDLVAPAGTELGREITAEHAPQSDAERTQAKQTD